MFNGLIFKIFLDLEINHFSEPPLIGRYCEFHSIEAFMVKIIIK